MKNRKHLLVIVCFVLFLACNDAVETYETSAELNVPVLLEVGTANNDLGVYSLNGIAAFCLGNKEDVKNCPGLIVGVTAQSGAELQFDGVAENHKIESLSLEWGYGKSGTYEFEMQTPINLLADGVEITTTNYTINIDDFLAPVILKMNEYPRGYIIMQLSGYSNSDVSVNARIRMPLMVKSENVSTGFAL